MHIYVLSLTLKRLKQIKQKLMIKPKILISVHFSRGNLSISSRYFESTTIFSHTFAYSLFQRILHVTWDEFESSRSWLVLTFQNLCSYRLNFRFMKIISSMWRPGNPDCQLIMTNVSEIVPGHLGSVRHGQTILQLWSINICSILNDVISTYLLKSRANDLATLLLIKNLWYPCRSLHYGLKRIT